LIETTSGERFTPDAGTEAVTRAADVLLLFLGVSTSLGVSEIARQLNLSKAVVHRILRSLLSRNLLAFDEGQRNYRLGPASAALGARALRDFDLHQVALPVLRRLQLITGETATVTALIGTSRVYLDQVLSLKEIKMVVEMGRPFPLHAGSSGKVILAFAPADLRQLILSGPLAALTPNTRVTRVQLEADLEQIKGACVASSLGERQPGAGSVAGAIIGYDGYAIGSISVCGPVDRFGPPTISRLSPLVKAAAREISLKMGWDGNYPKEDLHTAMEELS
jgi:DNA-binding IclR family transcriptional regulator